MPFVLDRTVRDLVRPAVITGFFVALASSVFEWMRLRHKELRSSGSQVGRVGYEGIAERTVNAHLARAYRKLEVDSRAAAAAKATQRGLL